MLFPLVTQIGSLVRIAFFLTPFICMVGKVKTITHHVHSGHLSCNITGILSHCILAIAFQMARIITTQNILKIIIIKITFFHNTWINTLRTSLTVSLLYSYNHIHNKYNYQCLLFSLTNYAHVHTLVTCPNPWLLMTALDFSNNITDICIEGNSFKHYPQ